MVYKRLATEAQEFAGDLDGLRGVLAAAPQKAVTNF
jgi:hypothetical protein